MSTTDIMIYINNTPENTNLNVLKGMLNNYKENSINESLLNQRLEGTDFMSVQIDITGDYTKSNVIFYDVFAGNDDDGFKFYNKLVYDKTFNNGKTKLYYIYTPIQPQFQPEWEEVKLAGYFRFNLFGDDKNKTVTVNAVSAEEIVDLIEYNNGDYIIVVKPYRAQSKNLSIHMNIT